MQGALFPLAYRVAIPNSVLGPAVLLDALVTRPLAVGTYLAFRFFPPMEGYTSSSAVTVGYPLPVALAPGDVLRLAEGPSGTGTALQLVQYAAFCDSTSQLITGLATTETVITANALGWSCFLYCIPSAGRCCTRLEGIAAVGATSGAMEFMPPPNVLPCQFTVAPAGASTVPPGAYVAYAQLLDGASGAAGALPINWYSGAWQALKYATWTYSSLTGDAAFAPLGPVAVLEASLYVAPAHGALVPVAYRPHYVGTPSTAQLAVVATMVIPAGTQVAISADPTPECTPYWVWTAPLTQDILPGTVVLWSNLSLVPGTQVPATNFGTIQYVGATDATDADLTEFTVFTYNPLTEPPLTIQATYRYITAVYTCARGTGSPLPPCLTVGRDMPAAPWPATDSILPITSACCAPPIARTLWPCFQNTLCALRPVAWSCQELPHFFTPACCPQ